MSDNLTLLRGVFRSLLAVLVAALLYLGVWFGLRVDLWFIDLHGVIVEDTVESEPIPVLIDRTIHRDFQGGYNVTVRELPSHLPVCTTGDIAIKYDAEAILPETPTLSWWAYGARCNTTVPDLRAGFYQVETCHFVDLPFFPRRTRCVTSNEFRIWGADEPTVPEQQEMLRSLKSINSP